MATCLTFTLPFCPPSVNSLYTINFRAHNPADRIRLRPDCQTWKTKAKLYVPQMPPIPDSSLIRVDRTYYYQWFTVKGKWVVRDTSNMDKILFDAIAEKLGLRKHDARFKVGMMDSRPVRDRGDERTVVVLKEITLEEWSQWE